MTTTSNTPTEIETDIVIYIESFGQNEYRVRYDTPGVSDPDIIAAARRRMLKSFSLGRNFPDAYTIPAIIQKANLMSKIFRGEYGFTSVIVNLILE